MRVIVWLLLLQCNEAFAPASKFCRRTHHLWSSTPEKSDDENVDRTTFDQAGRSLIEEEDMKRLQQMGDYDSNPDYQTDSIEKMRQAIRERTTKLGMEKSQVSAEYIKKREQAANAAGTASAASEDNNRFGGLDLSQISSVKQQSSSQWNEDMPSMFYDPEDEMSKEEQEAVDPVMKKNIVQQGLNELQNAKWPGPGAALREVALMLGVIAITAALIIFWDKLLRTVYMGAGFIPSKEDLAQYADRFSGLDLPKGWTDNMNQKDIEKLGDMIQTKADNGLPGL